MRLCCGGLVDRGQLKQLPLSSHPPPSHSLSHQTWPSETDCRLAPSVCCGFGKMAKRGYVGGTEKERHDFNWEKRWLKILESTASMQMEAGRGKSAAERRGRRAAEEKGGTKPKSELLPNYCKSSFSACSCPGNLSLCSIPLLICPRSSTDADLISKAFSGLKKSGHTLAWGTNMGAPLFRNLWWIDMSWNLKVCIPKKERSKVEITPSWFSQGEMEEKGGEVKWKMAACQVAKCPFSCLLVLYTLLHHKHLIAKDRLQWTRVCVPAITCSSDHKMQKASFFFFTEGH